MTIRDVDHRRGGGLADLLDEGKQPPPDELRDWLVEQFVAALAVTARRDAQSDALVRVLAADL
ncbi:hypothetical protein GCM10023238_20110 [Streptomyces heliomycini]